MLRSRSRDGVLRIRPRLFHTTADDGVSRLQFDQSWLELTVLADCMSKTGPSKRSSTTSRPRISSWTCARGGVHRNPPSRFVEMIIPMGGPVNFPEDAVYIAPGSQSALDSTGCARRPTQVRTSWYRSAASSIRLSWGVNP